MVLHHGREATDPPPVAGQLLKLVYPAAADQSLMCGRPIAEAAGGGDDDYSSTRMRSERI